MYTHTKFYGTETIPTDEIGGGMFIYWLSIFLETHTYLGEFIEGLKHFAVSDVKFHPQKYVLALDTSCSLTQSSPQHAASCGYDKRVFFWTFNTDHDQLYPQISGRSM